MRTPAGKECRFFYGDYFRGRKNEECRLLNAASPPEHWTPDLCFKCPVPDILMANACPNMILEPRVTRPFPFLKRQVKVYPHCTKTLRNDFDPHLGCGECHPVPDIFHGDFGDTDSSSRP
jgi:hypothetical protein